MSVVATAFAPALVSGDGVAPVVLEDALVAPIVEAAAKSPLGEVELLAGALVRSGSGDGVTVVVEL